MYTRGKHACYKEYSKFSLGGIVPISTGSIQRIGGLGRKLGLITALFPFLSLLKPARYYQAQDMLQTFIAAKAKRR